jgi:hypothetical protein
MAARLDGELYALGEVHCPIDVLVTPRLRLAGVLGVRAPRLIAELATAAWVWGATPVMPARWELCVDLGARARPQAEPGLLLREVVLHPGDAVVLGEARVTSPLRTAVDLVRARERLQLHEADAVAALARTGGFGLDDALAMLERRRNLPAKRRAAERLRAILG